MAHIDAREDNLLQELGVSARDAAQIERQVIQEALASANQSQQHDGQQDSQTGTGPEVQATPLTQHNKAIAKLRARIQAIDQELKALSGSHQADDAVAVPSGAKRPSKRSRKQKALGQAPDVVPVTEAPDREVYVIDDSSGQETDKQAGILNQSKSTEGLNQTGQDLHAAVTQQRLADLKAEKKRLSREIRQLKEGQPPNAGGSQEPGPSAGQGNQTSPVEEAGKPEPAQGKVSKPEKKARVVWLDDEELFGSSSGEEAAAVGRAAKGQAGARLVESERDRMIRLGLITPFQSLAGYEKRSHASADGTNNPFFDRRPLTSDMLDAAGRSGKPLNALISEMNAKTKTQVANRPITRVVDASQMDYEREIRNVPAHFWQSAASAKRLPPSLPNLATGGAIPNLAVNRAPLPPASRPKKARSNRRRENSQESAESDDAANPNASSRACQSRRHISDIDTSSDHSRQSGTRRSRRSGRGTRVRGTDSSGATGSNDQNTDAGGDVADPVLPRPPAERASARRAMQRLEQIVEDEDEGSESSEYMPSDDEQHAARNRAARRGRQQQSSEASVHSSDQDEDEDDDMLASEGEDNVAVPCTRQRRGHAQNGAARNIVSDETSAGDSEVGSDDMAVSAGEAETAEDLEGRYDDADEEFYLNRLQAATVRLRQEDEVAAAASGGDGNQQVDGFNIVDESGSRPDRRGRQDGKKPTAIKADDTKVKPEALGMETNVGIKPEIKPELKLEVKPEMDAQNTIMPKAEVKQDAAQPAQLSLPSNSIQPASRVENGIANRLNNQEPGTGLKEGDEAGQGLASMPARGNRTRRRADCIQNAANRNGNDNQQQDSGAQLQGATKYVEFDGGLKVALRVWGRLFAYQRTGVQWLWELHCQEAGGILGDEMGLGKTVQVAAYLGALYDSKLWPGPCLIVCPATVMRQWLRELRCWAPKLRVVMMHESARPPTLSAGGSGEPRPDRAGLVSIVRRSNNGVLLTSYEQLRLNRNLLTPIRWGVVVLDEGHKIRNPDAEVTLVAKQLATPHRLVVSGSPIQNKLSELWSLLDFVYPGKLGTLPIFQAQFAIPIQIGGYTNANQLQVSTAYRCALVLRDLVAPHLLRRRKADVAIQLPTKTEQVLFCTLSSEQLELYRAYLASVDVTDILNGQRQALAGIDILRKITNHPDLLERLTSSSAEEYGAPERSGKLTVTKRLLQHWTEGGHKTLLFCQTQQMLDIIEKMVGRMGITYHRMDGSTSIAVRSRLMDDFNNNPDIALFLLTTKVGGLGVNLVGADRVLLYDPDWNPATDAQARERAWRIGQSRPVTVYRLITSGTIEEKVYHRQVYKSFLTNKVLKDPRQKRFFAAKDLHDLFTLGDEYSKRGSNTSAAATAKAAIAGLHGGRDANGTNLKPTTETARIFGDAGHTVELDLSALDDKAQNTSSDQANDGVQQQPMDLDSAIVQPPHLHSNGNGVVLEANPDGMSTEDGEIQEDTSINHETSVHNTTTDQRRNGRPAINGNAGDNDFEYGGGSGRAANARQRTTLSQRHTPPPRLPASRMHGTRPSPASASPIPAAPALDTSHEAGDDPNSETHILKALFEGAGVRSLIDHSRVEGVNDPEALAAEAEANRVATRAAEALRRSRTEVMRAPINTPTWTGRHGTAGAPARVVSSNAASGGTGREEVNKPKRFGRVAANTAADGAGGNAPQGSAAILQQLRARQKQAAGDRAASNEQSGNGPADANTVDAQLLAAEIVQYIDTHGGQNHEVGSTELITAFRSKVPDDKMHLFRQLLNQVAVLNRKPNGGFWKLKREFWGSSLAL